MSPTASRRIKIAVSLGLAALLLFLFLRSLDFREVGAAIARAHPGWLALAAFSGLVATPLLRSERWRRLLARAGTLRRLDLNAATCVGFAASTLLPARAGEVVRPVYLSQRAGIPVAPAIASIALERVLDLIATVTLFVIYAAGWAPRELTGDAEKSFALLRRGALALGVVTAVGIAVLVLLIVKPALREIALRPVRKLLPARFGDAVGAFLESFLEHLGVIRTVKELAIVLLYTAGLWLLICFQIQATLRAFDLDFPFPVSFFVLAWSVIGLAVPTPGGVGGYHAAVAFALAGFYGVAPGKAGAFALVSHAISFGPITLLGLGFLVAGGLTLKSLAAAAPGEGERVVSAR